MMNKKVDEHTIFPSAPITEAILDIRAELPEKVTLESILAVQILSEGVFLKKKSGIHMKQVFSSLKNVYPQHLLSIRLMDTCLNHLLKKNCSSSVRWFYFQ